MTKFFFSSMRARGQGSSMLCDSMEIENAQTICIFWSPLRVRVCGAVRKCVLHPATPVFARARTHTQRKSATAHHKHRTGPDLAQPIVGQTSCVSDLTRFQEDSLSFSLSLLLSFFCLAFVQQEKRHNSSCTESKVHTWKGISAGRAERWRDIEVNWKRDLTVGPRLPSSPFSRSGRFPFYFRPRGSNLPTLHFQSSFGILPSLLSKQVSQGILHANPPT